MQKKCKPNAMELAPIAEMQPFFYKKPFSMTDVVETAFDENGVDLTFERQEENEENKHHGFKR